MFDDYRIEFKDGKYRLFRRATIAMRGAPQSSVTEDQMIGVFATEEDALAEIDMLGPVSFRLSAKGAFSYWMQSPSFAA